MDYPTYNGTKCVANIININTPSQLPIPRFIRISNDVFFVQLQKNIKKCRWNKSCCMFYDELAAAVFGSLQLCSHTLTCVHNTHTKMSSEKFYKIKEAKKNKYLRDIGTLAEWYMLHNYKSFNDIRGMFTFFVLFHAQTLNIQRINYVTSSICLQCTSIIIASQRIVSHELKLCTQTHTRIQKSIEKALNFAMMKGRKRRRKKLYA